MLSQMMGHSSIKITLDLYSHLTEETVKTEIDKFSNYMDRMVLHKVIKGIYKNGGQDGGQPHEKSLKH